MDLIKRLVFPSILLFTLVVIAQTPTPTPTPVVVGAPVPWANSAIIVLIVNTALGVLATFVYKVPGKLGDVLKWIFDIFSANIKH